MRSTSPGRRTSEVEVTNVSRHGIWLLLRGREIFLPYDNFPWFRQASMHELFNVTLPQPHHLYWPDLDVDLHVDSIEHPQRYPLVSRERPNKRIQRTRSARR